MAGIRPVKKCLNPFTISTRIHNGVILAPPHAPTGLTHQSWLHQKNVPCVSCPPETSPTRFSTESIASEPCTPVADGRTPMSHPCRPCSGLDISCRLPPPLSSRDMNASINSSSASVGRSVTLGSFLGETFSEFEFIFMAQYYNRFRQSEPISCRITPRTPRSPILKNPFIVKRIDLSPRSHPLHPTSTSRNCRAMSRYVKPRVLRISFRRSARLLTWLFMIKILDLFPVHGWRDS